MNISYNKCVLYLNHLSLPNNPDIAQIVFLRGYIDKIGRGTLKILEACRKADFKIPVWNISDNTVKLTFSSKVSLTRTAASAIEMGNNRTIDRAIDRAVDSAIDSAVGGTTNTVKAKVACVLKCIIANEGKRNDTYVSMTKIPVGSIGRYMKLLREGGLIEFIGEAAQTGGYFLTDKMKNIIKNTSKKH